MLHLFSIVHLDQIVTYISVLVFQAQLLYPTCLNTVFNAQYCSDTLQGQVIMAMEEERWGLGSTEGSLVHPAAPSYVSSKQWGNYVAAGITTSLVMCCSITKDPAYVCMDWILKGERWEPVEIALNVTTLRSECPILFVWPPYGF